MEKFFDPNLKTQGKYVFFDPPKEVIWNSFSPSPHERDTGDFPESTHEVENMDLDY